MGVINSNDEFFCPVAPHRLFHALFVDAHELTPKLMPHVVKGLDFISGDGSPGSVMQVNFVDGHPMKYVKHRLDLEDRENFVCKYTVIECPAFGDKIDYICHEVKFEASGEGSICKMKVSIHTKGDAVVGEEEIKAGKDNSMEMYKTVIAYLVENPQVYA